MRRRDFIIAGTAGLLSSSAWARQADTIEVPIRLDNARVLVEVALNGRGGLPFLIDTGGVISGMKQALANSLGLRRVRNVQLNRRVFPLYEVAEVVYGAKIRQERVALFGLDGVRLGAEGLLAAGVVTAMDSELEFERGVWRVHPGGAPALAGYERLPSEMRTNTEGLSMRPYGDVVVNGRTLRALWDTGAPRSLSLHFEEARRMDLIHPDVPFAPIGFSEIQGRHPDSGRLVRVNQVRIGAARYDGLLVAIRPEGNSVTMDPVLGLPVMRTLDMAFDRSAKTFSVRRNTLSEEGGGQYGLAGLWCNEIRGGVRVDVVGTGSPAAAAGVRAGDMFASISRLRDAIDQFNGPPGKPVSLRLIRNGQPVTAAFELRAYL